MSNIISSDPAVFGIFKGEFGTNVKIRKSAFQDEFLGKNKNVGHLTTLKICCTEFTPSEKISLNFEIWTRVLKHPVVSEGFQSLKITGSPSSVCSLEACSSKSVWALAQAIKS